MHATMGHSQRDAGGPVRGTFYPSEGPRGGAGAASALSKILAFVAVIAVLRTIARAAGRAGHGGSSRWSRRREAIAQFHRELHSQEEAGKGSTPAGEGAKA